ncbi:MAG: hypothetical protein JWQ44_449 [Chthoniobacter sp.]|nr:hypothetical protein [Chthoniobacter sp.]
MRICTAVIFGWLTLTAMGGDWRDDLTPATPGGFAPLRPMKASYEFGWGAFTAATADFDYSQESEGVLQLKVNARSVGAVRAMWRMDAQHSALCNGVTLRPIRLQQTETYRDEVEQVTADFSPEGVVRLHKTSPPGATPPKLKKFKCPDLFDLQTALLFVRSQPLQTGDRYSFVVYPGKAAYLARVDVIGPEQLKAGGRQHAAVKLEIALQRVTKDLKLETHKKFKQAVGWLSDDDDRLLLKVKAEVFVGSVWAELKTVALAKDPSGSRSLGKRHAAPEGGGGELEPTGSAGGATR